MSQFIGYRINPSMDDAVPVSTGATYNDALMKAIMRVLLIGDTKGEISVRNVTDLSSSDFNQLTTTLDRIFKDIDHES